MKARLPLLTANSGNPIQSIMPVVSVMLALLIASGCVRQDMTAVPDRGDHSFNPNQPAGQSSSGSNSAGAASPASQQLAQPIAPIEGGRPRAGESVVTLAPGERLYQVAQRHGVTLRWLIERNDLSAPAQAGQRLIVPRAR